MPMQPIKNSPSPRESIARDRTHPIRDYDFKFGDDKKVALIHKDSQGRKIRRL
jgi:hypothetical protein